MALRQWVCHKTVEAEQILHVDVLADPHSQVALTLVSGEMLYRDKVFIARGCPAPGDYFVRYADGYESWSPARAFEEGYTLCPP